MSNYENELDIQNEELMVPATEVDTDCEATGSNVVETVVKIVAGVFTVIGGCAAAKWIADKVKANREAKKLRQPDSECPIELSEEDIVEVTQE